MMFLRPTSLLCHLLSEERKGGGRKPRNNGVIILSYCEIDELHLLFLPLKPWLTQCSSALCTADPCIPHTAGTQPLELGHHRDHSACSKVETRSSSKCYREFSEAHQFYENLFMIVGLVWFGLVCWFFFFGFFFAFFSFSSQ